MCKAHNTTIGMPSNNTLRKPFSPLFPLFSVFPRWTPFPLRARSHVHIRPHSIFNWHFPLLLPQFVFLGRVDAEKDVGEVLSGLRYTLLLSHQPTPFIWHGNGAAASMCVHVPRSSLQSTTAASRHCLVCRLLCRVFGAARRAPSAR